MPTPADPAVSAWLASIGLDEYAPGFAAHRITLETLPLLSDDDLRECGVAAVGDRRRLQLEIRRLLQQPPPPAVEAAAPAAPPATPPATVAPAAPAGEAAVEAAVEAAPAGGDLVEAAAPPAGDDESAVAVVAEGFREHNLRRQRRLERMVERQRARSFAASMAIATLSVILLGLVLAVILIRPLLEEVAPIVAYAGSIAQPEDDVASRKVSVRIRREPSARSSSLAKVIAANAVAPAAVPVPDVDPRTPSFDFGSGDDFGAGWGDGGDGAGGFGSIPATMRRRCSPEDRLQRLLEAGGTEQCEEAVVRGLGWLQRTQAADGGWGQGRRSAMTGLALLAFLGHCETPLSEHYGDNVLRGLVFLVNLGLSNNGKLVPRGGEHDRQWPYEHAIATYALAEATTFCRQLGLTVPNLPEVTQKASQFIIDNQHKGGGWDYGYAEDGDRGGDLSVTAWQVQALKAANHTGLDLRDMHRCMSRAMNYVAARCDSRSGGFGYTGKEPAGGLGYHTLTGAGMLCLQLWGRDSSTHVRKGAEYLASHSRFDYQREFCDLYGHYYESQAMLNRGGEQWKKYNAMFRDQLLGNQNPDGAWRSPGGGHRPRAVDTLFIGDSPQNTHYRTCLCLLMLEVYYRFLPGTGGR